MEMVPRTNPPRAWHACIRKARVGARRLERIDGRISVKDGTNVAGRKIDRSWTA